MRCASHQRYFPSINKIWRDIVSATAFLEKAKYGEGRVDIEEVEDRFVKFLLTSDDTSSCGWKKDFFRVASKSH